MFKVVDTYIYHDKQCQTNTARPLGSCTQSNLREVCMVSKSSPEGLNSDLPSPKICACFHSSGQFFPKAPGSI